MKKLNLYYVYDTINEIAVTGIIPLDNHLTAALGFRDSYIKNKKSPYNYQQLMLKMFATVEINQDGEYGNVKNDGWILPGKEIMDYIASELKARGIDDVFDEEEIEGEE